MQWAYTINVPGRGVIGIDEAVLKECAAITLDLLLHVGVVIEEDGGGWSLAPDYHLRRIYLFGDAKTIENVAKFVCDMQARKITYSIANLQGEVFLEAMSCVRNLPVDWHTGLNLLTSMYNLYYVRFLDQFQDILGWNRINKEVRTCYFHAS